MFQCCKVLQAFCRQTPESLAISTAETRAYMLVIHGRNGTGGLQLLFISQHVGLNTSYRLEYEPCNKKIDAKKERLLDKCGCSFLWGRRMHQFLVMQVKAIQCLYSNRKWLAAYEVQNRAEGWFKGVSKLEAGVENKRPYVADGTEPWWD